MVHRIFFSWLWKEPDAHGNKADLSIVEEPNKQITICSTRDGRTLDIPFKDIQSITKIRDRMSEFIDAYNKEYPPDQP